MISHSKKILCSFGQKAGSLINKGINNKNTVRNTVRNRQKLSEIKNGFLTLSDTCQNLKTSISLINRGLSDLSEVSDDFWHGLQCLSYFSAYVLTQILNSDLKRRLLPGAEPGSFFYTVKKSSVKKLLINETKHINKP